MVTSPNPYRSDIDGLRALAVLPVLLFHAKLGCPGGFVGVDIFFVISGFLISSLIIKELNDGTFSLISFWERRVRRIMPALVLVVLSTLAAGWFLLFPQGFKELGESASAQAILSSNIYFWVKSSLNRGYFAPAAELQPLLHTWSLAVEEQFYLLFPLLLIFSTRLRRISGTKIIGGLAVVSFGLSIVGSYSKPFATFYLLHTRAWELLVGTLLTMMHGRFSSSFFVREAAGWFGFSFIVCALFYMTKTHNFPDWRQSHPASVQR